MRILTRVSALVSFAALSAAPMSLHAQGWSFTDAAAPLGRAVLSIPGGPRVALACTRTGVPAGPYRPHNPDALEIHIAPGPLFGATPPAIGQQATLQIGVDGQIYGQAAFLHENAENGLVSLLPRSHPLISALGSGRELEVTTAQGNSTIKVSLNGSTAAIAQLSSWCDGGPGQAPGSSQATGSSFDCANAATPSERAICTTPQLAALDRQLSESFATRLGALSEVEREALTADQNRWLALRNTCLADAACLAGAIEGRLAQLASVAASDSPATDAPGSPAASSTQTAAAPETPPAPPLSTAVTDRQQVNRRLTLEVVRAAPNLLQDTNFLDNWYSREIQSTDRQNFPHVNRMTEAEKQQMRAQVAAQVQSEIARLPAGPFLIAKQVDNHFINADVTDEGLRIRNNFGPRNQGQFTYALGSLTPSLGYLPVRFSIRARSDYDTHFIPGTRAQAEALKARRDLGLNVAILVDDVRLLGPANGGAIQIVTGGRVVHAGLYEGTDPTFDPARLVHSFSPSPVSEGGLSHLASQLNIPMHGNAVLDGATGTEPISQLVRILGAAKAVEEGAPADRLAQYAFLALATPRQRNNAVPPSDLNEHNIGRGETINFAQHVNEFDRAEAMERVTGQLWPTIAAQLPKLPIEGIATTQVYLQEYDAARGGFPLQTSVQQLGLPARGPFPALKALPDFLPLSPDQARQLVEQLNAAGGPGSRRASFVVPYRLTDVVATPWDSRGQPEVVVEPLSLTLHGVTNFQPGMDPQANPLVAFDLAGLRGEPRPEASPERKAFWAEVAGWERSTVEQLIAAALATSDDPGLSGRFAADATVVYQAGEFDKEATTAAVRSELESLEAPETLILDGTLTLDAYDPNAQGFPVTRVSFASPNSDSGIRALPIRLSDPSVLQLVSADPELAERMSLSQDAYGAASTYPFTMRVKPVLTAAERNNEVMFVAMERIVIASPNEDGTGYPAGYVDLAPDQSETVTTGPAAPAEIDAPAVLPLDPEYLDLLMLSRFADQITPETYDRMMVDRRLMETRARTMGVEPSWGFFFQNPSVELNPVQYRAELDRFREWTQARAAALPSEVYVRTRIGNVPSTLICDILDTPPRDRYADYVTGELAAHLDEIGYRRRFEERTLVDRAHRESAYRLPWFDGYISGRPAFRQVSGVSQSPSQSSCVRNVRLSVDPEQMARSTYVDAAIEMNGPFLPRLAPTESAALRHYGTLEVAGFKPAEGDVAAGRLGTLLLRLPIDKTEARAVAQNPQNRDQVIYSAPSTLDEASLAAALPARPTVTDILGMTPGDDWSEARAKAAERLPDALIHVADGPPVQLREQVSNTLMGPETAFQAFRNGEVFLDPPRNEALALFREPTRDPDRVLAVASYRIFDASQVTQESLIGALLKKYGDAPITADDPSRRGSKPGKTLVWGMRESCLPQMRGEVRVPDLPRDNHEVYSAASNLARAFPGPQLQYSNYQSVLYSKCEPLVWASVGADQQNRLHIVVWSFDLSLLDEVARMPDLNAQVDGDAGSAEIMENAADIDL